MKKYHKKFILGNIIEISTRNIIDEVGFIPFVQPYSYTGEDVAEIHCHGNPIIIEKIIRELYKIGFSPASAGEFTKRAFLNNKINVSQVEATSQIIHARNNLELKSAFSLKKGYFQNEILDLKKYILDIVSDMTAELDFIDQDIQFISNEEKLKKLQKIIKKIECLLENTHHIELYSNGLSVLVFGSTNVGKSSLLNLLLGYDRSIVSKEKGTTRDYIQENITIEEHTFRIIDTAGIRFNTNNVIEEEGIAIANEKLKEVDIVLLLLDTSIPLEQSILDSPLSSLFVGRDDKSIIIIGNKIDIIHSSWLPIMNQHYEKLFSCFQKMKFTDFSVYKKSFQDSIFISVKQNKNIKNIKKRLIKCVQDRTPKTEGFVLSSWQKEILNQLKNSLQDIYIKINTNELLEVVVRDFDNILELLGILLGEISNNDILDKIFSKFCIGK